MFNNLLWTCSVDQLLNWFAYSILRKVFATLWIANVEIASGFVYNVLVYLVTIWITNSSKMFSLYLLLCMYIRSKFWYTYFIRMWSAHFEFSNGRCDILLSILVNIYTLLCVNLISMQSFIADVFHLAIV